MLLAVSTVCAVPWFLGGAIPLARLVLQVGATASGAACIPWLITGHGKSSGIPVCSIFALLFAALGLSQMLPVFAPPVSEMDHAVRADLRATADFDALPDLKTDGEEFIGHLRTISPSDTRMAVAQWLSLAILGLVGYQTLNSRVRLLAALSLLAGNAVIMTIVGLLQLFGDGKMMIGSQWILFDSRVFGTFTNANNAAGWLCVHLAIVVAVMILIWGRAPDSGYSRPFEQPSLKDEIWSAVSSVHFRLANLNNWQILNIAMLLTVLCGIFASLSRSGMVAVFLAIVAAAVSRLKWKQAVVMLVPLLLIIAAIGTFLAILELDTLVVGELRTLKDPISQTTGRLLHWSDVLKSAVDFPLLGSGMNAYRFSTLPYVAHSGDQWYYHADNQFVEVLVESGLAGLCCFVVMGLVLLLTGIRLSQAVSQVRRKDQILLLSLGVMTIMITSTQAVTGFFDYGCGLPAVSSVVMLMSGAAFAPFGPNSGYLETTGRRLQLNFVVIPSSRATGPAVVLAMITSAGIFIPDLWAAHAIHEQAVAADRLLKKPVSREALGRLPEIQRQLREAMKSRPDDVSGLHILALLHESQFRFALIQDVLKDQELPDARFAQVWESMSPQGLAGMLIKMRESPETEEYAQLNDGVNRCLSLHPWSVVMKTALYQVPLIPGLRSQLLAGKLLPIPVELDEQLVCGLMFSEPAHARRLFQAGYFCLKTGRQEAAEEVWNACIQASDEFRVPILTEAANHWTPTDTFQKFGPADYVEIVRCAALLSDGPLRQLLWSEADRQWGLIGGKATLKQQYCRAIHLQQLQGNVAALEWLDQCLNNAPSDLEMGILNATLHEQQGNRNEAIGQWSRIQYFHPEHAAAAREIKRLEGKR